MNEPDYPGGFQGADERPPRAYVTEVSVPVLGDGGVQRLQSRMKEPELEAGQ
jgi:hypothetical protein